jgi:DNA-binding NarL/FixJ family response regulator
VTEGAQLGGDRGGDVWIVPDDDLLAAALGASLSVVGWSGVRLVAAARLPDLARDGSRSAHLVLVASDGRVPDARTALARGPGRLVVAVGSRAAWSSLAAAAGASLIAAVVDADQPLGDLVDRLDRALRGAPEPVPLLAAALREREREARLFAALTEREQDVLGALLAGRSASEIAARERVSLATVRSHIRAVLSKLGVSSQLAAVALAQRSCREPRIVDRMREIYQF